MQPRSRTRGSGPAVGIVGPCSFAAIGQCASYAGLQVLAVLGAARGRAEESTFRRPFAMASGDAPRPGSRCLAAHQAVQGGGRLVIAVDGKTVRRVKSKSGKASHLFAALAPGLGVVLGQVAVGRNRARFPLASPPDPGPELLGARLGTISASRDAGGQPVLLEHRLECAVGLHPMVAVSSRASPVKRRQ
jgi:hypothetical protein